MRIVFIEPGHDIKFQLKCGVCESAAKTNLKSIFNGHSGRGHLFNPEELEARAFSAARPAKLICHFQIVTSHFHKTSLDFNNSTTNKRTCTQKCVQRNKHRMKSVLKRVMGNV